MTKEICNELCSILHDLRFERRRIGHDCAIPNLGRMQWRRVRAPNRNWAPLRVSEGLASRDLRMRADKKVTFRLWTHDDADGPASLIGAAIDALAQFDKIR